MVGPRNKRRLGLPLFGLEGFKFGLAWTRRLLLGAPAVGMHGFPELVSFVT